MSDIYIPELMELNSYWQNAVEEAIQDTLTGEKRLYYALKNRKKIKKKLQQLGIEPDPMRPNFDDERHFSREGECSDCPNSCMSFEKEVSQVITDPDKSQSRSKTRGETPQRKIRNPDRPLLGDGSLEKMTKSQNSFNNEPMGMQGLVKMEVNMSDSDKDEGVSDHEMRDPDGGLKKMQGFDGEYEKTRISKRLMSKRLLQRQRASTRSGGILQNKSTKIFRKKYQTIPINFDPRGDLFWENEVKNAIRVSSKYERKLQLALAKREILNQRRTGLGSKDYESKIIIDESIARIAEKKRGKKILSPFIRFYLDVYRELCLKCPLKQISEEAAKRWLGMSLKQKSHYSSRKAKKGTNFAI